MSGRARSRGRSPQPPRARPKASRWEDHRRLVGARVTARARMLRAFCGDCEGLDALQLRGYEQGNGMSALQFLRTALAAME